MTAPVITVVGSINLDFVASAAKLPAPGETVTGAALSRHPGGKGANQALAARRLGAEVTLIGRVGADTMADEALALLRQEGVNLADCIADARVATGVALIAVAAGGENQIVVAPGANAAFEPEQLVDEIAGALICQLELPIATVAKAVGLATGFVCVNLAPAAGIPDAIFQRADLIVVNEGEAAFYGARLHAGGGLVAVTYGAKGAALFKAGRKIASAAAPKVKAVDTTGAGDCFVAALTVALAEGMSHDRSLAFACAAGAITATRAGAQTSLPTRTEVQALLP
jgi:ribokinase